MKTEQQRVSTSGSSSPGHWLGHKGVFYAEDQGVFLQGPADAHATGGSGGIGKESMTEPVVGKISQETLV